MAKSDNGLTDKQQRFCEEFLKDFNGTQAYVRAGYSSSIKTAEVNASKLLRNAKVQAYLAALRKEVGDAAKVTLERTIQEIGRVAFSNITQILTFDSKGVTFKQSEGLPEAVTAAIESVKSSESTRYFGDGESETTLQFSGKMHNKVAALKLLADFFGITMDFNQARAALRRYGLELAEDLGSELGWRLEAYASSDSADSSVEADQAAEDFFQNEND